MTEVLESAQQTGCLPNEQQLLGLMVRTCLFRGDNWGLYTPQIVPRPSNCYLVQHCSNFSVVTRGTFLHILQQKTWNSYFQQALRWYQICWSIQQFWVSKALEQTSSIMNQSVSILDFAGYSIGIAATHLCYGSGRIIGSISTNGYGCVLIDFYFQKPVGAYSTPGGRFVSPYLSLCPYYSIFVTLVTSVNGFSVSMPFAIWLHRSFL